MKLYTFTSDTDYGLNTWVFSTRAEAEAAMEKAVLPAAWLDRPNQ